MSGLYGNLRDGIDAGALDASFIELYGEDALNIQKVRYLRLLSQLYHAYPDGVGLIVSAPGRTELGGNHTDHNNGNVLAAAVDLDCVAAVTAVDSPDIEVVSEGYGQKICINLDNLDPVPEEVGTAAALARGMAAAFKAETGVVGGFRAYLHATCKAGTGLSTSAAFAVLIGGILNFLYNSGKLSARNIAYMAGETENRYFGKPCGLMDQVSSAVGTTLAIDFEDPHNPQIRKVALPDDLAGFRLVVVDTGGSHVELTPDYAAIPREMCAAARILGREVGRGLTVAELIQRLPEIRRQAGDRAALRLLHFIEENDRAVAMAEALDSGRFTEYLKLVRASGESSCMLLQNCSSPSSTVEQGIILALALSRRFCPEAVCRVHGGGFAGTVQAYVPESQLSEYCRNMDAVFGEGAVMPLRIGRPGVCVMTEDGLLLPTHGSGEK
jgi:galactokinase